MKQHRACMVFVAARGGESMLRPPAYWLGVGVISANTKLHYSACFVHGGVVILRMLLHLRPPHHTTRAVGGGGLWF